MSIGLSFQIERILDDLHDQLVARHGWTEWARKYRSRKDKLLSGDPDPPLSTLLQLAHGLGLRSIEELLGPFETTRVLDIGRGVTNDD